MKNCLVTKLKTVVNNSNLTKLNEYRIDFKKRFYNQTPSNLSNKLKINLTIKGNTNLEIVNGNAQFIDEAGVYQGKLIQVNKDGDLSIIVEAMEEFTFSISDKSAIEGFGLAWFGFCQSLPSTSLKYIPIIDIYDLRFLNPNLHTISLLNCDASGDVSLLSIYPQLKNFEVPMDIENKENPFNLKTNKYSKLYGDGQFLFKDSSIRIAIKLSKITADIAKFPNEIPRATVWYYSFSSIYGDVSKGTVPVSSEGFLELGSGGASGYDSTTQEECNYNIFGDICLGINNSINKSKILSIDLRAINNIYGNLAMLDDTIFNILNGNGECVFSYDKLPTTNRKYVISSLDLKLEDDLDKYLIAMSELQMHPKAIDGNEWDKTISVIGKKTSASDIAIQKLKTMGYTVVITNTNE